MKKVQEKELKWVKTLAQRRIKMYRKAQGRETAPAKFELPFEEKLASDLCFCLTTWSIFFCLFPLFQQALHINLAQKLAMNLTKLKLHTPLFSTWPSGSTPYETSCLATLSPVKVKPSPLRKNFLVYCS